MKKWALERYEKIWEAGGHNAFTDLVFFRDQWFVAFREAESHALSYGSIRVLVSRDARLWAPAALFSQDGWDLRDPHFFTASDGLLGLVSGATRLEEGSYTTRGSRVSFSPDGVSWGALAPICAEGDWLWRVEGTPDGYWGISYRLPEKRRWTVHLMHSADGLNWRDHCDLNLPALPNEATVRVLSDGRMLALVRTEEGRARALLGVSSAPYTRWTWRRAPYRVGGPNFIELADGSLVAGFRQILGLFRKRARLVLAVMTERKLSICISLPSGGDCSYPGLAEKDGKLYVSWYSSHEGKAAVYFGVVRRV